MAHVVRRLRGRRLGTLQKEYEELDKLEGQRKSIAEQFRLDGDVDGMIAHVERLLQAIPGLAPWLARIHTAILRAPKAPQIVAKVVEADEPLLRWPPNWTRSCTSTWTARSINFEPS